MRQNLQQSNQSNAVIELIAQVLDFESSVFQPVVHPIGEGLFLDLHPLLVLGRFARSTISRVTLGHNPALAKIPNVECVPISKHFIPTANTQGIYGLSELAKMVQIIV